MPASQVVKTTLASLALAAFAACATTPSSLPAYASSPDACALVLGGGGTVSPDEHVNERWLKIDTAVTDAVAKELQALGYHVEEVVSAVRPADARLALVESEFASRRCNRLVQVAHFVEPSPTAPRFGFDASVLAPDTASPERTSGGTRVRLKGEFEKRYSYDLTGEALQTLSMGEVGRTIARDIDRSGVVTNRSASPRTDRAPSAASRFGRRVRHRRGVRGARRRRRSA